MWIHCFGFFTDPDFLLLGSFTIKGNARKMPNVYSLCGYKIEKITNCHPQGD